MIPLDHFRYIYTLDKVLLLIIFTYLPGQNFLESLLVATVYTSSRRLYGDVVKHWQRLLKVPFIQKLPYMQGVVFRLLMMYVSSCSKVCVYICVVVLQLSETMFGARSHGPRIKMNPPSYPTRRYI